MDIFSLTSGCRNVSLMSQARGGLAIFFFLAWFLPWWYLRAFAAFGVIHPSNGSSSSRGNTQWVSCLRGTLVTRSNLTLSKSRTFYWQDTVSKRWLDFEHEVKATVRCKHRQMIRWLEKKRWSWCLSTHPCGVQWRCATIFVWGATYGCDYNYYRWLSKQDMTFWCEVNTCESRTHFGGTLLQVSLEGGTFGWDINSFEFWRWDIWVGH